MAKIQPSVLNLTFDIPSEAPSTNYLDLSQCASIVNRRFYRQGLVWVVAGFTVSTPTGATGDFSLNKLPSTWVCSNAWHKAYAHWKAQQDDAVEAAGAQSAVARYRDFKVYADTGHVGIAPGTFDDNLIPIDSCDNAFSTGEWQPSQIVIPNLVPDASGSEVDPYEYNLHVVGENQFGAFSRGVIDGYSKSRAYPQSPDPVSPSMVSNENWMKQMIDVGNDATEIIDNAVDKNDDLPYDQVDYPGGQLNAPCLELIYETNFVPATGSTTRSIRGTTVPCGLIQIMDTLSVGFKFYVHLVPGPARGYLTQPMQDM